MLLASASEGREKRKYAKVQTPDSNRKRRLPKSHFEQVHRVSEFGGLNLVKTPSFDNFAEVTYALFATICLQPAHGKKCSEIHFARYVSGFAPILA